MRDTFSGVAVFGLSLFALLWLIPNGIDSYGPAGNGLSAAFWPSTTALILLGLGLVLGVQNGVALYRRRASARDPSAPDDTNKDLARIIPILIAVALLIPYYYFSAHLGLVLSSVGAFVAYSLLAGERHYLTIAIWAIATPVIITLFFTVVAQVLIPLGPLTPIFK